MTRLVIFILIALLSFTARAGTTPGFYELNQNSSTLTTDMGRYAFLKDTPPDDPESVLYGTGLNWIELKEKTILRSGPSQHSGIVLSYQVHVQEQGTYYFHYPYNFRFRFSEFAIFKSENRERQKTQEIRRHGQLVSTYLKEGIYDVFHINLFNESQLKYDYRAFNRIFSPRAILAFEMGDRQLHLLIYGIGLAFIFYGACMFALTRKSYFISYALYSSSVLNLLAISSFHIPLYSPTLQWAGAIIIMGLFAFLMSDSILDIKAHYPQAYRLTMLASGLGTILLAYDYIWADTLSFLSVLGASLASAGLVTGVFAAFRRMLSGYAPASFLAVGWLVLVVTYLLQQFNLRYWQNELLSSTSWIAYGLESLLFAIALAYRTKDDENRAITERIHALAQLEKVVYPHQIERIKSGENIETTMPTSSGLACVISFDIIGSSRIKHIAAKDFLLNLFLRCSAAINEGYNGRDMKAAAYRIKEMGDGFLCSVGYPFQSLSDNPANDSYQLAQRFAKILSEEARFLESETPVCCGIGIALDTITGFFPASGTKEYDLFGRAIVLATRYEGMRKIIGHDARSILILHEKVYLSLDKSYRQDFTAIDLQEQKIVIRDDPGAERLYFRYLDVDSAAKTA